MRPQVAPRTLLRQVAEIGLDESGFTVAELLYHKIGMDPIPAAAKGGCVSIGNFDGVHRGHRRLIEQVNSLAQQAGGPAVVVTFDPPPIAVLRPELELPLPLTTLERRTDLLGSLGVDFVVALVTDENLLSKSAEGFFEKLVVSGFAAKALVEGPNFRFGRNREGDTDVLERLASKFDLRLKVLPAANSGDEMISSTRIRKAIQAGDIAVANEMLSAPHEFSGKVSAGEKRGRELGFPTANLTEIPVLTPSQGVFAATTRLAGDDYACAVHIGPNPTFSDSRPKVEVHVIGWSGDLYGQALSCRLLKKIRDVKKFENIDALKAQIESDVTACVESV